MKFLQGDEWYEIMMGTVGLTPARASMIDKWISLITKAYPALQGRNLNAFMAPLREKWADPGGFFRFHKDALDILGPAMNRAVRDNQESVEIVFREAARQVNAVQAELKARAGK